MNPGKLIVFEGISGTGKETQAKLLRDFLHKKGIQSTIVYHPSPELKQLLGAWRKDRSIDHIAETYLLLADRQSRVRQMILPALAQGQWVMSLRSWVSAQVYQGKTEKDTVWIKQEFARFEPNPDYVFYFDIDPDMAFKRAKTRHEKTGEPMGTFETKELLHKMRNRYRHVLKFIPHTTIDASGSVAEVHQTIIHGLV